MLYVQSLVIRCTCGTRKREKMNHEMRIESLSVGVVGRKKLCETLNIRQYFIFRGVLYLGIFCMCYFEKIVTNLPLFQIASAS